MKTFILTVLTWEDYSFQTCWVFLLNQLLICVSTSCFASSRLAWRVLTFRRAAATSCCQVIGGFDSGCDWPTPWMYLFVLQRLKSSCWSNSNDAFTDLYKNQETLKSWFLTCWCLCFWMKFIFLKALWFILLFQRRIYVNRISLLKYQINKWINNWSLSRDLIMILNKESVRGWSFLNGSFLCFSGVEQPEPPGAGQHSGTILLHPDEVDAHKERSSHQVLRI